MTQDDNRTEEELVNTLLNHLEALKVDKQNYDNTNQIIADLMRPNDTGFNRTVTAGEREDQEIVDTTASRASTDLASILQSQLTTPGEKWAVFEDEDEDTKDTDESKKFYEDLSNAFFNITKDSESNFYQKNHEFFLDIPVFGTGAMFVLEDEDNDEIVFELKKLQEIYCDQNNKGVVDVLYREFEYTARQAEQEFGKDNLGEKVTTQLMKDPSKKTRFTHHLLPMRDYMRMAGINKNFKKGSYKSIYISIDDKKIVKQGFFNEKPFAVARWSKRIGQVYGFGVAWDVLSDIEVLNILSLLELEAFALQVRPPLLTADEGVIGATIDWTPGGILYGAMTEEGRRLVDTINLGFDPSKAFTAKESRIKNIESAFFVDKFRERDGVQPLTATEALIDEEKRLSLLSPQSKRLEDEYLTPVIKRTVSIIIRQRKIEVPEIFRKNINYNIKYISPLSFTTRKAELGRYNKFVQNAAPFLQIAPETISNFKTDDIIRTIAEKSGIPLNEMKSKKEVIAEREAKQQEQARQQQLLDLESGAGTVEKLAKSGVLENV